MTPLEKADLEAAVLKVIKSNIEPVVELVAYRENITLDDTTKSELIDSITKELRLA